MKIKKVVKYTILLGLLLSLTACLPNDGTHSKEKLAGFFWGIWHGWIAPISLIISLFRDHIGIYEVNNNGFWYNLAFYIAVISGFGSVSLTRNKCKRND